MTDQEREETMVEDFMFAMHDTIRQETPMAGKLNDVSEVLHRLDYYLSSFNDYWNESGMFLDASLDYEEESNEYLDRMLFIKLQRDQPELYQEYLDWCKK